MNHFLNILPGLLTWLTILFPIIFSFWWPEGVAIFILLFVCLWLIRSLEFAFFLIRSYLIAHKYLKINWKAKYQSQDNYQNIHHIIIIATYKEPFSVLQATLQAISKSKFDLQKIIIVLATEERDKENALKISKSLKEDFGTKFAEFYTIMHPQDIPNEIKGKGANITYAGKEINQLLTKRKINPEHYIITTLDADNQIHPQYLANLTYHYLKTPDNTHRSFQPLPLFYNNIWEVPLLNRLVAISSSFWHLFESGFPDRLRNFSSHAQSLAALRETDFWSTQTIVEDGHQFWRSFFAFNGNHAVVPLFIPIYQDAVQNHSYHKSLLCQYLQLRRWAWGATDIPYTLKMFWKKRQVMPWGESFLQIIRLINGHYMWATAPVIITMATPIPRLLNPEFQNTVLGYNIHFVFQTMFSIALIGILVSIIISFLMLPKPPPGIWYRVSSLIQWALIPITTIFFGAIPAIDAQTRLMLGYSLDFNVTEKVRKK